MRYAIAQSMSQTSNFEIPARFSFRPFSARWQIGTVEVVGWWEKPKYAGALAIGLPMVKPLKELPEHEQVTVRIGVPDESTAGMLGGLYGMGLNPSHTVEMFRADIPTDILGPHESRKTSPDISGRTFSVLMCSKPEFKTLFPQSGPGDVVKNAWAMRDEFLNLDGTDSADLFDWIWSLRQFLNRWGLWSYGLGFHVGLGSEMPGFAVAFPHLLRQKREEYRKALESKNARKWLRTAPPLSFRTINAFPYFLVERFYCEDGIHATITIDHLAERQFGICKRHDCRKLFERTTRQRRLYCSPECAHLANIRKLRAEKRKARSR